jgi:hypothetical protein
LFGDALPASGDAMDAANFAYGLALHRVRFGHEVAGAPVRVFATDCGHPSAASQMASGGTVEVLEDDPTGLADSQDPDVGKPEHGTPAEAEPGGTEPRVTAGDPLERSRQPQTGL